MEFPVGVSDFEKLIQGDYLFTDKTLFIKEVVKDGSEVIVITRPRRFGKTLNLSMLHYFLSENYYKVNKHLFDGLDISKDLEFCKKHQGQYPVIFISFKDVKEATYDEAYAVIVELISTLYEQHNYLLEGDCLLESERKKFKALSNQKANKANVKTAIKQLAIYMKKKFKKNPIILIDEYDTPIQQAYLKDVKDLKDYYEPMVGLMRSLLGQPLKDNIPEKRFLEKSIITGITRIAQESLFSGVNNLEVYSMLEEKYGQYFGFTEEEVLKLIKDSQQTLPIEPIKEWYNGYQVGKYVLYNPWSIIKCLKNKGALDPYWLNTASNDLIVELLSKAGSSTKLQFEKLLQGEIIERPISKNLVFPNLETHDSALWSLLLYAGYLKVLSTELTGFDLLAQLAIPNKEVGFVYNEIIARWFAIDKSLDAYRSFIQSLRDANMDEFKRQLSTYIMQAGSFFDFSKNIPEQTFHIFVLGLIVGLREEYIIQSNRESGVGRVDVILIPKNKKKRGILIEFKKGESPDLLLTRAQEALEQIKNQQYMEIFKQYETDSVLIIGLAFCGKQVELVHETILV